MHKNAGMRIENDTRGHASRVSAPPLDLVVAEVNGTSYIDSVVFHFYYNVSCCLSFVLSLYNVVFTLIT